MLKRFREWFSIKSKIDILPSEAVPLFNEKEVWWCNFGENVGSEENGKNSEFLRPVIVYKKFDRYMFLGIPLTSKIKKGSWYVSLYFHKINQTVILNQARSLSGKRLQYYMGTLVDIDYEKVKTGFRRLYM